MDVAEHEKLCWDFTDPLTQIPMQVGHCVPEQILAGISMVLQVKNETLSFCCLYVLWELTALTEILDAVAGPAWFGDTTNALF